MLQIEGLYKSFGDRAIFTNLNLSLLRGDKIGLIAPNGSGKTTLMNILVGLMPYDQGRISMERDLRWAYLPQLPELPQAGSILEAVLGTSSEQARLTLQWETATLHADSQEMERLLPLMEAKEVWSYEQRAKEILGRLGLTDYTKPMDNLSGGERKRIALASTLISQPDLLFLDEPTNHLDLTTIEWLENYLAASSMSLVLITHDRYFLDRVCNTICEIEDGQIYRYRGNYDYYLEKREERWTANQAIVSKARNLYRTELDWMRRQPQARAGKAKYRIDAFYELEKKTKSLSRESKIELGSANVGHIGKKIFEANAVTKRFCDKTILQDFSYQFARYDKIGIVGENGVGKTTFLRMLLGLEQPDSGHFDIGQTIRFGYYSQQDPNFSPDKRVIDIVSDIAESFDYSGSDGIKRLTASQILTQFLFPPERQYTQVGKLSGGELRRLYLCTILVGSPNFLVLDEPTNDLDILTLQVLEEYLQEFTGCVLIVSHDRFFMDKVVEHLFAFEGEGVVRDFPGNYSLYRAYREEQERLQKQEYETQRTEQSNSKSTATRSSNRPQKLSYAEKKELEQIIQQIPELEQEKSHLEQQMSSGMLSTEELLSSGERIAQLIDQMDELVLRQLELEEKQ